MKSRLFLLLAIAPALARAEVIETDVLVFGGTASGVAAACTAARLGKRAVVTEFGTHIGGLTSGGLGWTDIGNKAAIGGFAHDFYKRLGKHYGREEAWWFEPSVAERELRALLAEAKVPTFFTQRLANVKKEGARIVEIAMENGNVFRARMFIDCTYEGDLMARAGVRYMVGREANERFGETLNGIRDSTPKHQFLASIDPYVRPGDLSSGLLPFIQDGPFGKAGDGDRSVQAYNFRLCLTKNPANKLPIEPPPGYDPARYELLGRYVEALAKAGQKIEARDFLKFDMVTPDKTDSNNEGPFSTDFIGQDYDYVEGDYATRAKIWQAHLEYIQGFLTFLANDARVPEHVRTEFRKWGLCRDEFTDTGGWPHAMYVREARRMLGEYVMAERVCRQIEKPEDSVGLGAYGMDSHNCRRLVRNGRVENEGDVQVGVKQPYPIAYRSIVPTRVECENLLVPVCLSATHIAYGSIRMEPVFMILGQSAATAAALAIDGGLAVQAVNYEKLRNQLLQDNQVLAWPGADAAASVPKLGGILLDDADASRTGEWIAGTIVESRRIGTGYVHDGNAHKGAMTISWAPDLADQGEYEIVLHFPPHPNRATNVPVTIEIEGRKTTLKVNEQAKSGAQSLGKFMLPKGRGLTITLSNADTDGYVVADGVQLVR
jgi:hypothetical protein